MKLASFDEAKVIQRKRGYVNYNGPLLNGPRFTISIEDEHFPHALTCIPDPPQRLYAIGNIDALKEGLAVIGARKATPYGLSCAEHFSRLAAIRGVPIISGGAYGCDAAAHKAALSVNGSTIVFLGGGCDQIYPAAHHVLFQEVIDKGGVVVSENEWDYPALPFTFRNRNRLIAGLAKATLIVEAGLPSGTFSTADEALSAGKDVLVVPGAITSASSDGSNQLLYQGATPIVNDESFHDVLFNLFSCLKPETNLNSFNNERQGKSNSNPLLAALQAQPMRVDQMISSISVPKSKGDARSWIMVTLAELERDGLIARYPDGRFGPVKGAQ